MFYEDDNLYYDSDNPLNGAESEASNGDENDGCDNEGSLSTDDDVDDGKAGDKDVVKKVVQILNTMKSLGMDLASFLDALSWGNGECIKDSTIRGARTQLMKSNKLPCILSKVVGLNL